MWQKKSFLLSFQGKKKLVYKVGLKQLSVKHLSRTVTVFGGILRMRDRYLLVINLSVLPIYSPILKIFKESVLVYNHSSKNIWKSQRTGQKTVSPFIKTTGSIRLFQKPELAVLWFCCFQRTRTNTVLKKLKEPHNTGLYQTLELHNENFTMVGWVFTPKTTAHFIKKILALYLVSFWAHVQFTALKPARR
jgi:hypothetical protein